MSAPLLDAVQNYSAQLDPVEAHGYYPTPVPGLNLVRATQPSGIEHAIWRPLICLVLQGAKQLNVGAKEAAFGAGDSILLTADLPTVSQITQASEQSPYLSMVIDLDIGVIAELVIEMSNSTGAMVEKNLDTSAEVSDVLARMMQLLARPQALTLLHKTLTRELHYWLLAGRLGAAISLLGRPDSHARRIARAVTILRNEFAQTVSVERLALVAGMSSSSFHQHFRAVTSLSPRQFQKQLRLIEARRLILASGMSASSAAFAVGYQSVPQFTREFARMFGRSPGRLAANTPDAS